MPSGKGFSLQNPTAELLLENPVSLHLLGAEASGSGSVGRNVISQSSCGVFSKTTMLNPPQAMMHHGDGYFF